MTTIITPDARHIGVDYRSDLAELIPHSRRLNYGDCDLLVFPNGPEEARLARNLGVYVPPPVLTKYDWAGASPWDIQRTTTAMLTENARAYVLSTMGTGKTRAVIWALDYLKRHAGLGRVLIAAPLSTLNPVWQSELFSLLPRSKVVVLHGSREKRLELLRRPADYYVVNHHGLNVIADAAKQIGFDAVVIDELAVLRTRGTLIWKAANKLINEGPNPVKWAWGLTGSPTPNAPTDAWAQIKLLTPGKTVTSMRAFQEMTMREITKFKWVAKANANDIVHTQMQPSVRYTRDDVMELPETTYVDRDVVLDKEGQRAYDLLFNRMRMATGNGSTITAVNEAVLQNKLLQVACGFIYTDDRTVYSLPCKARMAALDEVIEETDRKVIVFAPFVAAVDGIVEHLRTGGHSVAHVYGATPRHVRDNVFRAFQSSASDPRILVAHPQTMAHGLTLTEANTIVWYGPTNSLEIYEQANARITRPGQKHKTLIVHLGGTKVEKATYQRLRRKSKMQGILLQMFKDQEVDY